ncbi:MAG: hypothetical protein ACRBCT_09485 [Alphaproteobacteria bacterium]
MGSISSRPSVPSTTVVYQSIPTTTTTNATSSTTTSSATEQSSSESASESREASLLKRDRGRTGTVQTSFRGLVENLNNTQQRKTLLGE